MKNILITASCLLALASHASKFTYNNFANLTATEQQEKGYKQVEQSTLTSEVLKSVGSKYKDYTLAGTFISTDNKDYRIILTKGDKKITAYYKSTGEFIKEEVIKEHSKFNYKKN